jgi:hypothetical protein
MITSAESCGYPPFAPSASEPSAMFSRPASEKSEPMNVLLVTE